jgi:glycosyltransferase involved in cell wall biosynthesis
MVAMMRVLHLVKGLGPGGAERLLVSLAGSRSDDVEVEVAYLLPDKSHLVPELVAAGVTPHLLAGRLGLADPRWPLRLRRLVRRSRPDVVHLHSPAAASVARVVLRAQRSRPAIVSTEHNVWRSFGWLTRTVNAVTAPLDDVRFAVSEEVRASMGTRGRTDVEVLLHGIPVRDLARRRGERSAARASLGITDETVLVATVANFREKKDYPTLLAAAAACCDVPRLQFVAVGQGPLEAALRTRHRDLGLGERFRFLGYRADPPAVVVGADLFVLTSRHEGLPIALLEAMALGVPPIASAVGGIPEVITDGTNGILVAAGEPLAFAEAFRALTTDPARRRHLGEEAASRAAEFDIARTQAALEARYRALLPMVT